MKGQRPGAVTARPERSEKVLGALRNGATPVGRAGAVRSFTYEAGGRGGTSEVVHLYVGERRIEVNVSPTGRSVRVWVDGTEA